MGRGSSRTSSPARGSKGGPRRKDDYPLLKKTLKGTDAGRRAQEQALYARSPNPLYYWDQKQGKEIKRDLEGFTLLPNAQQKALRKIRENAWTLDYGGFLCCPRTVCCGKVRIGRSFWIGLIPEVGPFADFIQSTCMINRHAAKFKLGGGTWAKIIGIEVGMLLFNCFVPEIGDFITINVRPNGWIVALVEKKTLGILETDHYTAARASDDRKDAEESRRKEERNEKRKKTTSKVKDFLLCRSR